MYSLFEPKVIKRFVVSCRCCGWEAVIEAENLSNARILSWQIHDANRACEGDLKIKKIKKNHR